MLNLSVFNMITEINGIYNANVDVNFIVEW